MVITIPGECVAKQRPRAHNNIIYTPAKTTNYEGLVALCANEVINNGEKPFINDEALECKILICTAIPKSTSKKKANLMRDCIIRPTKKPDIDNCVKSILDGMNGVVFKDDKQVVSLLVEKIYADIPSVRVVINAI